MIARFHLEIQVLGFVHSFMIVIFNCLTQEGFKLRSENVTGEIIIVLVYSLCCVEKYKIQYKVVFIIFSS